MAGNFEDIYELSQLRNENYKLEARISDLEKERETTRLANEVIVEQLRKELKVLQGK